jgi:MFS family permease
MSAPPPDSARRDAQTIAIVSLAHGASHFSQLLLAPLFPWIKEAMALSYAELGLLMTTFYVVSGFAQAAAGFVVDRVGAVPVLLGALALFALAALGLSLSVSYPMMLVFSGLAGLANSPFHPVDFSIINARVTPNRLGRAYAVHGICGNLGWAAAPVFLVGVASVAGWRAALAGAAVLLVLVLLVVWYYRALLVDADRKPAQASAHAPAGGGKAEAGGAQPGRRAGEGDGQFAFLRLPAVWMSFAFFFAAASMLSGVQSFGPESARQLHDVPLELVGVCLTAFMLASAVGMLAGGIIAADANRAERVIGWSFGGAALVALLVGYSGWPGWTVPVLFAVMGFGSGIAGPSRDLLVRRATPPGATGRVYGMVYSGLDVGAAFAPAVFGVLMDTGHPALIWAGIAIFQALMIASALNIGRLAGRTAVARPA